MLDRLRMWRFRRLKRKFDADAFAGKPVPFALFRLGMATGKLTLVFGWRAAAMTGLLLYDEGRQFYIVDCGGLKRDRVVAVRKVSAKDPLARQLSEKYNLTHIPPEETRDPALFREFLAQIAGKPFVLKARA